MVLASTQLQQVGLKVRHLSADGGERLLGFLRNQCVRVELEVALAKASLQSCSTRSASLVDVAG